MAVVEGSLLLVDFLGLRCVDSQTCLLPEVSRFRDMI